jgi:hypothetical protein
MEPSDAKSIAESLIHKFSKDIPYWAIENTAFFDFYMGKSEIEEIIEDVYLLIENAKLTVTFEGETE